MSVDNYDGFDDSDVSDEEYQQMVKEKKKELLLENRRARLTTMSFHDWFLTNYKREYRPADKAISLAYHAGAAEEIENNEYVLEHSELKMQHYRSKANRLADNAQILYSLLGTIEKKADMPEQLKKLVRKTLNDLV